MKFVHGTHEPDIDMGYIYLKNISPKECVKQREVEIDEAHLILDFDNNDKLVGIEVFRVSKTLHADTIKELKVSR